ncbi:mCG147278 [Mus musculus]|nr:mCG147278 [Mus musculus]
MRILKAKYFLSQPFLQLTVAVSSCGVGGVTRCLEGGFCVTFSSLIKAEGRKHPLVPHGHLFFSSVFHCEGKTCAWGQCSGPAKPNSCSAVCWTHPYSGRRELTSASCPLTSTYMSTPLQYIKNRIDT